MSDHISGPRALAEPIADITDLYAFPSPERPGRLVLVMNTLPFAQPSDAFSDGLIYRFRLRPLTADASRTPAPFAVGAEEFVFDCVFSAPARRTATPRARRARAPPPAGETVSFRVNDERGGRRTACASSPAPRWDPFIMDAPAALKTIATGQAGVHRSGRDLSWTARTSSASSSRSTARAAGRRGAGRRGRGDPDPRQAQRPHRARRAARGEEHDAGAEAVRPGEPRPRDPRPVQHGGRVPPRRRLPGRLPGAAERQPRLLGRPGRQDRLARRTGTAPTR